MSAHQGNSACRITVDPSTADVLRIEAKKVLMFNHDPFEDFLDYTPRRQLKLADIYRDATAVIDALGWDPEMAPHTDDFEVPLTRGHIDQLHERRCDLLATNLDLLTDIGADNHRQRRGHERHPRQPPQRRSPQPHIRRLQRDDHPLDPAGGPVRRGVSASRRPTPHPRAALHLA